MGITAFRSMTLEERVERLEELVKMLAGGTLKPEVYREMQDLVVEYQELRMKKQETSPRAALIRRRIEELRKMR